MALAGKVAVITGGTKGIGAAISATLHAQGASIVATYASDASSAQQLSTKLGGERVMTVQSDAGSVSAIETLVKDVVAAHGKIDILIPNAGILPMKDLESTSEQDFDATFATNVKGVYFLCQKALPHLQSGSRIVLLSTTLTVASTVMPNYLLYNATKGAIEQMTRVMAKDLGRRGITVNAVAPGPTATELFLRGKPEALIKGIASANPFNRLGQPEEIAGVVASIASESMGWVNGQVIRANGGMA